MERKPYIEDLWGQIELIKKEQKEDEDRYWNGLDDSEKALIQKNKEDARLSGIQEQARMEVMYQAMLAGKKHLTDMEAQKKEPVVDQIRKRLKVKKNRVSSEDESEVEEENQDEHMLEQQNVELHTREQDKQKSQEALHMQNMQDEQEAQDIQNVQEVQEAQKEQDVAEVQDVPKAQEAQDVQKKQAVQDEPEVKVSMEAREEQESQKRKLAADMQQTETSFSSMEVKDALSKFNITPIDDRKTGECCVIGCMNPTKPDAVVCNDKDHIKWRNNYNRKDEKKRKRDQAKRDQAEEEARNKTT